MNRQQMAQMMNNPQFKQQFMQKMQGFNPSQILDQIANNPEAMQNPMVQRVMELRNNHDSEGLTSMADNMFKENGMNFSEYTKQLKQQLGYK